MGPASQQTAESGPNTTGGHGRGGGQSSVLAHRIHFAAMSLLTVALASYLMREFAGILQQLFVAAFIGYLILPIHQWFVRRGIASWLAYVLLVSVFLAGSYGLGQMIYHSFYDLTKNIPRYQQNLSDMTHRVANRIPGVDQDLLQQIVVGQAVSMESGVGMIRSALGSFFNFVTQMAVVLVYLVFLLAEQSSFRRRIDAAFGREQGGHILAVVNKINSSIAQCIAVKTLMSLLTGTLTAVILLLLGVDFAILWGIIAFLLNYIPYLGSLVATLLPALLALVDRDSPWRGLATLLILGAVQNSIGYIVEPRVAGNRLNLSPLIILLSLAFGGAIWGIVGMILAVPFTVAIKAILENLEDTKPLGTMMSNI